MKEDKGRSTVAVSILYKTGFLQRVPMTSAEYRDLLTQFKDKYSDPKSVITVTVNDPSNMSDNMIIVANQLSAIWQEY